MSPATPVWSRTDLSVASQAKSVAGVLVLYRTDGRNLQLTGLDPKTGANLWSRAATVSGPQAGITVTVTVLADKWVAYYAPGREHLGQGQLVILDPVGSGTEIARSGTHVFYSTPSACEDNPEQACVSAFTPAGTTADYRLQAGMTALQPTGAGGRAQQPIGEHGLMRFLDGQQVQIGVTAKGKRIWSRPEAQLLGPGFSTNGGWAFDYLPEHDLFVGTVGAAVTGVTAPPVRVLASDTMTIAFRAGTGEVLWRTPGLDRFCTTDLPELPGKPMLACQWRSGQVHRDPATETFRFIDPVVALIDVDVVTGRPRWSAEVGALALDQDHWRPEPRLVPDGIVMDRVAGPVRISLADGSMTPAHPTVTTWGTTVVSFEQNVPWALPDGSSTYERHGTVWEPRQDGQATPAVTRPLPAGVGVRIGDKQVVTTKAAVTAYPN